MDIQFPVEFSKMSGTGNDFIVIDNRQGAIPLESQSQLAARVCRRMFSVGGDGLILIETSDKADFSWHFYNGDGSIAEMCGNGARCAARFAYLKKIAGKKMRFETLAGMIEAEIMSGESVKLLMTDPVDFNDGLAVALGGRDREIRFVNTGVPHAVCFLDAAEDVPVKDWGRTIRFHDHFQPAGTNANFVQKVGENHLSVRTYERGVEDETMACGTGAVASALWAAVLGKAVSPVAVTTSGGDRLSISFDLTEGPVAQKVYLQGPARLVYEGKLSKEALL